MTCMKIKIFHFVAHFPLHTEIKNDKLSADL